ncbi:MAG TPA: glycogen debranching N-terminal domain-containing protein [Candidatus Acidoferrales bacterium]|nr:glycogen debranching N-terminal domain-containing protein [Candidatus Acidoferrales bacterium]
MTGSQPSDRDLAKIRPRADTIQLSRGRTAFVSDQSGVIHAEEPIHGLCLYETRVLSGYRWLINGQTPEFSCGSNIFQASWMGYYIQAPKNCKETPTGECNPLQETVELRLKRAVGEGMHEDVQLTNHTQIATTVKLELEFKHQFVSREEVKNGRKQHGQLESEWSKPQPNVWELMTEYRAENHYNHQGNEGTAKLHRGIKLRIENTTSAPEYSDNRICFHVKLEAHGKWRDCLSWLGYIEGRLLPLAADCPLIHSGASEWDERRIRFFNSATVTTVPHADDLTSVVNRVLRRARVDLGDLRLYDLDGPGGFTVAAGVPTYMELFGRDTEAASWQASMLSQKLMRGTLDVLSKLPASEKSDWRDAEPGRIPNEMHTDPLAVLNYSPQALYFGSVSSCFLFPICLAEFWHWTGDLNCIRGYVDAAMGSLKWADTYSLDSTHFYRYQTHSEQGIKNQGWKDSKDAIVYPDGSQAETPIGTCEMQAFMYVAKLHFSEVLWWLGETDAARRLYQEAEELKSRFNEKFWMEEEGYYALGIDSKGN